MACRSHPQLEGSRTYLFPHLHFKLGVHNDNIVSASIYTQSHRRVDITDATQPTQVQFSYSVEWVNEVKLRHANRMSRYVDSAFLPSSLEIHWLSIINSFVLVLLLTTFLTVILVRVLKNDFSKYTLDEEEGEEEEEVREGEREGESAGESAGERKIEIKNSRRNASQLYRAHLILPLPLASLVA